MIFFSNVIKVTVSGRYMLNKNGINVEDCFEGFLSLERVQDSKKVFYQWDVNESELAYFDFSKPKQLYTISYEEVSDFHNGSQTIKNLTTREQAFAAFGKIIFNIVSDIRKGIQQKIAYQILQPIKRRNARNLVIPYVTQEFTFEIVPTLVQIYFPKSS